jgi:hypothetical protein
MNDIAWLLTIIGSTLLILRAWFWATQPADVRSIPWPRWIDPFCLIEDFRP